MLSERSSPEIQFDACAEVAVAFDRMLVQDVLRSFFSSAVSKTSAPRKIIRAALLRAIQPVTSAYVDWSDRAGERPIYKDPENGMALVPREETHAVHNCAEVQPFFFVNSLIPSMTADTWRGVYPSEVRTIHEQLSKVTRRTSS